MLDTHLLKSFAGKLSALIKRGRAAWSSTPFDSLAGEILQLQFQFNPVYQKFCLGRGISSEALTDWRRSPFLPISGFKEAEVSSLPTAARTRFFTSSGTTGQRRSRHFHSEESVALYRESALAWFNTSVLRGLGTERRCRIVSLTPPPKDAPNSSLVCMCDGIIHEFGAAGSQFIGTTDADGNWFCDVERLGAVNNDKGAVLLLGTAFLFVNWLEEVERRGMQIPLPTGSRIMETGGYKGRSREMSKVELHSKLEKAFGLVPGAVFTEYGMSELSSQAYEVPGLSPAELEFPPWTRSRVISPETGNEVGVGETGLIQVLDLANVWSACAIQTEDLGVRGEAGFKLIGRATGAEARGCSLMTL